MGKRLKQQKRGRGSRDTDLLGFRYKADLAYRPYDDIEKTGVLSGKVVSIVDDPARTAPLIQVKYENNEKGMLLAPEGIAVGDTVDVGSQGRLRLGSCLPLYRIPDGAYIYNIERNAGDGGTMVKAAGSYANIVAKEGKIVYIKLPSKATIILSNECRAQLGRGGRRGQAREADAQSRQPMVQEDRPAQAMAGAERCPSIRLQPPPRREAAPRRKADHGSEEHSARRKGRSYRREADRAPQRQEDYRVLRFGDGLIL